MFAGADVVAALKAAGVSHVVWLPDSDLGTWDAALSAPDGLPLIRVCREGEAFAIAAGLWLGGKRPIVIMQCTGLFEAGDSLRNFLHDLQLPLFFVVGVRSYKAHRAGTSSDTCPLFAEPILKTWKVPFVLLSDGSAAEDLAAEYMRAEAGNRAGAVLLAE
jgi:sulfopyruvate decarboxylase TPP-binding subunit